MTHCLSMMLLTNSQAKKAPPSQNKVGGRVELRVDRIMTDPPRPFLHSREGRDMVGPARPPVFLSAFSDEG